MENCNFKFILNHHFIVRHCTARYGDDTPTNFHCNKGFRRWCRFFYLNQGVVEFISATGKEVTVRDGDILFIPFDAEYSSSWKESENGNYYLIEFILEYENGDNLNLFDDITLLFKDAGYFKNIFYDMVKTVSNDTLGFHLLCQEKFLNLLYLLAMNIKSNDESHREIRPAIDIIEGDFSKPIDVNKLAEMCYISPATFRRKFLKYANMSPVKYRNFLRINKARELLTTGLYTVNQVAEIIGINDMPYFSKLYKNQFGVTPSSKK